MEEGQFIWLWIWRLPLGQQDEGRLLCLTFRCSVMQSLLALITLQLMSCARTWDVSRGGYVGLHSEVFDCLPPMVLPGVLPPPPSSSESEDDLSDGDAEFAAKTNVSAFGCGLRVSCVRHASSMLFAALRSMSANLLYVCRHNKG